MYGHLVQFLKASYKTSSLFLKLTQLQAWSGLVVVFSFFIMSGFFLYYSQGFKKYDLETFARRRIARLWPMLAFSFIPIILIGEYKKYSDTLNLFFITKASGLMKTSSNNEASWYVCVLFILSMFFFYALRHFKWENIAFSCGIISLFGFIVRGIGVTSLYCGVPIATMPFMINGMIEGLTGISFGILLGAFLKNKLERKESESRKKKILFTLFETASLFCFVRYICFHKAVGEFIFWEILFVILFSLFLFEKGFLSQALNNKFCAWLGQLAYPIYLMHFPMFEVMRKYLWGKPFLTGDLTILFVSITICFAGALIAQLVVSKIISFLR